MYNLITLHKNDNVAVVPMSIPANKEVLSNLISKNLIPFGHKIALSDIKKVAFFSTTLKLGSIIIWEDISF